MRTHAPGNSVRCIIKLPGPFLCYFARQWPLSRQWHCPMYTVNISQKNKQQYLEYDASQLFLPKSMRSLCVRTLGPVSGAPLTFDLAPSDAGRISYSPLTMEMTACSFKMLYKNSKHVSEQGCNWNCDEQIERDTSMHVEKSCQMRPVTRDF